MMRDTRARNQRIAFVAGPVVVHTGGAAYFIELIRRRLRERASGGERAGRARCGVSALRAHRSVSCCRKGVRSSTATPTILRAINEVRRPRSIAAAVADGYITGGVMVRVRAAWGAVRARRVGPDSVRSPDAHTDAAQAAETARCEPSSPAWPVALMLALDLHHRAEREICCRAAWRPTASTSTRPSSPSSPIAEHHQALGLVTTSACSCINWRKRSREREKRSAIGRQLSATLAEGRQLTAESYLSTSTTCK